MHLWHPASSCSPNVEDGRDDGMNIFLSEVQLLSPTMGGRGTASAILLLRCRMGRLLDNILQMGGLRGLCLTMNGTLWVILRLAYFSVWVLGMLRTLLSPQQ